MTAFKVYDMYRKHGEGSSNIGEVEGGLFNSIEKENI